MSKEAGDGHSAVPPPDSTPTAGRLRNRAVVLLSFLVLAAGLAILIRGPEIREWWLERQPAASLQKSAESGNADPVLLLIYARKQMRAGEPEKAVEALLKAEPKLAGASRETSQRVLALLGYLLARQGEGARAVPYLRRAEELDPEDAIPHLGFGIVFADRKMPKFAATQFELATQLDPKNVEAWYRFGKAAIENLKAQQAVEPLKKAVSLAPNDPESRAELGIAYAIQSQFAEAVPHFRKAAELAPDHEEYRALLANALAMNARTEQEYRESAELLKQARKTRPQDDNLVFTLGLLHLRFNQLEKARQSLEECIVLAPKNASAYYNLSVVQQRLGDHAAYEAARRKFQALTDVQTVTVNLEKSVASSPRDPALRIKLARAYRSGGNLTGAYWQLAIAKQLAPSDRVAAREFEAVARILPPEAKSRVSIVAGTENTAGPPPPEDLIAAEREQAASGTTATP